MKTGLHILLTALAALLLAGCEPETDAPTGAVEDERPNILFILADDLGYSDLSFYGSEIPTPNLDALAANGKLLTAFYSGLTCSPTRAMLMSGVDSHQAGLGVMTGPSREDHMGVPGYVGYLNFQVASLASLLADAGYDTYLSGKWHLGMEVETGPRVRGFKRSFASLDGAAHLGPWDWRGPQNAQYREGDELLEVDDDFYSTRVYTERMIEFIEADREAGRPWFAWLAYTAPHWPLQAPPASIERFRGWYDEGWESIYAKRYDRMLERGLLPAGAERGDAGIWQQRWDSLDAQEQAVAARHMEIYAAMVNDLDHYIGELIAYLKDSGQFDNTFIMFSSDNGPESSRRDLAPNIQQHVGGLYDHSLDNLGAGNSYVMYGPDWATVSGLPYRRHKATAFEGGIRVPTFVHYPPLAEPGSLSEGFGSVIDLLPTFLALAETSHPGTEYKGREVLPPSGRSLLPLISGERTAVHTDDTVHGWELFGHRGVRQGRWKIVWDAAEGEAARWRLFDLENDPSERHDLSSELPERLAQMEALWAVYASENGVIY